MSLIKMEPTKTEIASANCPLRANPIQQDPLSKAIQNALILDEVSKYISLLDMMNCRSANNMWKNEWTPVIQKLSKSQLCITDKLDMLVKDQHIRYKMSPTSERHNITRSQFQILEENETITRAKLLIEWIVENISNFPCSKFMICTQALNLVDQGVQDEFFCAISSIVTELHFTNNCEGHVFPFKNLENLSLDFCNLKVLEIQMCCFVNTQIGMALNFVRNVIQNAPKLDSLRLACKSGYNKFLTGCITAISNPKQIKSLHIDGTITGALLKSLREKNLVLQEFGVRFQVLSSFSRKIFKIFLKSQASSLKQLYIKSSKAFLKCNLSGNLISLPLMPVLELLDINLDLDIPQINLSGSFPKLSHLKVVGKQKNIIVILNQKPAQTVKCLEVRTMDIHHYQVLQACKVFSNMKTLTIPCTKANMEILNEIDLYKAQIKYLEELTLWCDLESMLDDLNEALTGYSKTELEAADQEAILVETRKRPLSFLQKVKILRLEKAVLTDLVCTLGPMKLSSLQCLDLRIPNSKNKHQISNAMLEAMREKFTVLL